MNKSNYLLLFILMLSLSDAIPSWAQEKPLPALVKPGDAGYVSGELIYSLDNKPTPECHASTLVEVSDGIVAAWFGGTYERHKDVGIWSAKYSDGKWSKPVEIVNGFQDDSLRYPTWNPVLFQPKGGPLMLFYKVGPNPRDWWGMLMTSEDEGRSWSYPHKLGEDEQVGHLVGPVKNKPIQLEDGSILCPSSSEVEKDGEDVWKVHFERTTDFGKTWEVYGPINDGIAFDAIQPSILTYSDGRMQILCRTRQGSVGQSWSEDGGKTWEDISASSLPNPNAGTDALTLSDGRQLLVYNHTTRTGNFPRGRNMLNVALSTDGDSWEPVLTLERFKGEYSYPAVIQAADGQVHVTYTFRRRSIKHMVLDPQQF